MFGVNWVALYRRHVSFTGLQCVTRFGNNNPMVHYPRTLPMQGEGLTLWGGNFIDFAIRSFRMEGFEDSNFLWTVFNARMQVLGGEQPPDPSNQVTLDWGITDSTGGTPLVVAGSTHATFYMIALPCIPPRMEVKHA